MDGVICFLKHFSLTKHKIHHRNQYSLHCMFQKVLHYCLAKRQKEKEKYLCLTQLFLHVHNTNKIWGGVGVKAHTSQNTYSADRKLNISG